MTERVLPGASGSNLYGIEMAEAWGQYSDGWIVPATDPTKSAQRYEDIDETVFTAFEVTYSSESLTVEIGPGEAFVDGLVMLDETREVTLEANTQEQEVAIGWDPDAVYHSDEHDTRDEADRVLVELASAIDADDPSVVIWSFDTDGSGVVEARNERYIGPIVKAGKPTVETIEDLPSAEDFPLGTEFFVEAENQSYEVTQDE